MPRPPNPPSELALLRYQAIAAFLALDPPRGQRMAILKTLATRVWTLPDGRERRFAAETLRGWIRAYRRGGIAALEDKPRPRRGVEVLSKEQIDLLCQLKRDVPERSLDRLILIGEETGLFERGLLRRSTVHRALQQHGLSGRPASQNSTKDLDRFEAAATNDLWQSDLLEGPWLPDPRNPDKQRRTKLFAFIDDHSRLLLAGRFGFKGDLPHLELVFREALRRCGVPRRVYYDNGGVYRSRHMKQVCATLDIHGIAFTRPYRPEGHGKIEAFNRLCTAAFIAEVRASSITTLDELNLAFRAWVERYYNTKEHTEIAQSPRERWRAGLRHIRHAEESAIHHAFLWSDTRKTDKTGVFSLHGTRYQTGPELARKKVEVRYDPERLDSVEVHLDGTFRERVGPLNPGPHRRPTPQAESEPSGDASGSPTVDWLAHLVRERGEAFDGGDDLQRHLRERKQADHAVTELLRDRLATAVFDDSAVRSFLERYGPLDPEDVELTVQFAIEHGGADQHIDVFLDGIKTALCGGAA